MRNDRPSITIEEIADPAQVSAALNQREQFDRNLTWLRAHAAEVYRGHRGKCICIAGQQLFVADSAAEALALAKAQHPDDHGRFVQYVAKEKVPRVYAN
jgi:hypothetical protein